jgi:hypothetical protein
MRRFERRFGSLERICQAFLASSCSRRLAQASLKGLATVSASVAASIAVGAAIVLDMKQKKKKASTSSIVNDDTEKGRRVQLPVYKVSPLLLIGQRWYDPTTLTQTFLKDHMAPRLKKLTKKEKSKKGFECQAFIKEET